MGLTRGQFLSVFLVLVGAAFFVYAFKTRQTVQECAFMNLKRKTGKNRPERPFKTGPGQFLFWEYCWRDQP